MSIKTNGNFNWNACKRNKVRVYRLLILLILQSNVRRRDGISFAYFIKISLSAYIIIHRKKEKKENIHTHAHVWIFRGNVNRFIFLSISFRLIHSNAGIVDKVVRFFLIESVLFSFSCQRTYVAHSVLCMCVHWIICAHTSMTDMYDCVRCICKSLE